MARQLSIVVVYPADTQLTSIRRVLEGVFNAELDIGRHYPIDDVRTCIIDVQVPDSFEIHAAKRRIEAALPTVRIKMTERFRESWWARHRWPIAIGIVAGLAVAPAAGLLRPLVARMREALG